MRHTIQVQKNKGCGGRDLEALWLLSLGILVAGVTFFPLTQSSCVIVPVYVANQASHRSWFVAGTMMNTCPCLKL